MRRQSNLQIAASNSSCNEALLMSFTLRAGCAQSLGFLIGYNNGFICIAARMLDYTIAATQDGGYNRTQIII